MRICARARSLLGAASQTGRQRAAATMVVTSADAAPGPAHDPTSLAAKIKEAAQREGAGADLDDYIMPVRAPVAACLACCSTAAAAY